MTVTVVISCVIYNNIASCNHNVQVNSNVKSLPMNGHKSIASKIPTL